MDRDANRWAAILHISQLGGYFIPLAGFIAPILIWQLKKEEFPELEAHGREVTNWIISLIIYHAVCLGLILLIFLSFGIGFGFLSVFLTWLVFIVLGILAVVFPIVGAIKAADGILWNYPLKIEIL